MGEVAQQGEEEQGPLIWMTDETIAFRLAERKILPVNYRQRLALPGGEDYTPTRLTLLGEDGGEFWIILRQHPMNPVDFCATLGYKIPRSSKLFHLRRYDGKSHFHRNRIEKQSSFLDFHIHMATERYQARGMHEEGYAEPTTRFIDLHGALECLLQDGGFMLPPDPQQTLFQGFI